MPKRKRKKRPKRGYPIAILIGFHHKQVDMWHIFSERVKPLETIKIGNRKTKNAKRIFDFHEAIIDVLRPLMREGVRSILISSLIKTNYAELFLEHVKKHHAWLVQEKATSTASFGMLVGPASNLEQVQELIESKQYQEIMGETIAKEADRIIDVLEKRLNDDKDGEYIIFSLKDIEDIMYARWEPEDLKPEYLLLTDKYLASSKQKNRLNKLMQIAKNRKVKVKVINEEETNAGKRVAQFGGIVCFTH